MADTKPRHELSRDAGVSRAILLCATVCFFVSGATGLVYQILWARKLSLFFGNDVYASTITLTGFMGGLAIGGMLAARFADRSGRPLAWYGVLELAIGVYAVFFTRLLSAFDPFFTTVYRTFFESTPIVYHLSRAGIAFLVLLLPTILMGATLPLILRAFASNRAEAGARISHFYAWNTFGALSGVVASSFVLMPLLGTAASLLVAAVTNIVTGCAALGLSLWTCQGAGAPDRGDTTACEASLDPDASALHWRRVAMLAIGVSGFGGLALEVVWTHLLIRSFSATVHSYSIMLCGFLLGIALGGKLAVPFLESPRKALTALGAIEVVLGAATAVFAAVSVFVPRLFNTAVWLVASRIPGWFGVGSLTAAFLVSVGVMLPSTLLLGAAFPVAIRACDRRGAAIGRDSGDVLFVNTLGAMLGALAAGFVLLPLLGSRRTLGVLGFLFLANGVWVSRYASDSWPVALKRHVIPCVIVAAAMCAAFLTTYRVTTNYNSETQAAELLYHREDIAGATDVVRLPEGNVGLVLDGNIEADTTMTQRRHFILKAHLPLMLRDGDKEVLVIGLGLGITTSALLADPHVTRVDVVECSRAVVEAQAHIREVNDNVLAHPRLHLHIDDGRNFLRQTERRYDVITADPIHPRVSGAANLYSAEYFSLVRDRLRENGAILQWLPMYLISEDSLRVAIGTMLEVFPNTSAWYVHAHLLLLGTKSGPPSFDYGWLTRNFAEPAIAAGLRSIGIETAVDFLQLELLSPTQLKRFVDASPSTARNTEDWPYLEYHTPFEYMSKLGPNVRSLLAFGTDAAPEVRNAPAGFAEGLASARAAHRAVLAREE